MAGRASSSKSFEIRPILPGEIEQSLELLRENFFPYEPCAVNIDLCPHGYKYVLYLGPVSL